LKDLKTKNVTYKRLQFYPSFNTSAKLVSPPPPSPLGKNFKFECVENSVLEGIFGFKTEELRVRRRNCIDGKPKLLDFFSNNNFKVTKFGRLDGWDM